MRTPQNPLRLVAVVLVALLLVSGAGAAAPTWTTAGAGTAYEADSGLYVGTSVDHGVPQDFRNGTDTIVLSDARFTASGPADVVVDQFTGTRTELSGIDATANAITIDPDDKSEVVVDGAVTELSFEDVALDGTAQLTHTSTGSGTITVTGLSASTDYAAVTSSGEVLSSGTTTSTGEATISVDAATDEAIYLVEPSAPTLSNPSPDGTTSRYENETLSIDLSDSDFATDAGDEVDVEFFVDDSSVGTKTVTADGTVTMDVGPLADGTHDWHVEATDQYGETTTSQTFSWTIDHRAPIPDNAQADPPDGAEIDTQEVTFSIPVSDPDFDEDGDEITATFYLDGEEFATKTLTQNGTVNATTDAALGESHTWHVEFEDAHGQTSSSDTFGFVSPAQLRIYKETAPSQRITEDNVNLTVRFYPFEDNNVISRQARDGVVNLTGLPVDERFVVTVEDNATDRYTYRRIVIDSIYQQQAVYLLNESEPNSEVVFQLDDPTGEFPPEETILYVEKPITVNNTTEYRTIAGDTFGSTGRFPVVLQQDSRYRLRVRTTSGQSERILGSYSVYGSTIETLQIQRIQPRSDQSSGSIVYGSLTHDSDGSNKSVNVRFNNPDGSADSVTYRILKNGNEIIPNTTSTASQFAHIYPVTANNSTTFEVEYSVDSGGSTNADSFTLGYVPGPGDRFGIDAQVMSIISWVLILATMGLLVIVDARLAPLGGVGMASGLVIFETVAIPMPVLGIAGAISVLTLFGGGVR